MFPSHVRTLAGAAALVSLAVACSDSTGTSGDRLTQAEAAFLATSLGAQSSAAAATRASSTSLASGASASAAVPSPFEFSLETTVPCPLGGNSKVSAAMRGSIDAAGRTLTADLSGSLEPASCVLRSKEGVSFTITGAPGLESDAHVAFTDGQPTGEHTASLEGGFSWSASDGRSGTCDVDYRATANYTSNQATVNGDFCGSTVTYTGPLR